MTEIVVEPAQQLSLAALVTLKFLASALEASRKYQAHRASMRVFPLCFRYRGIQVKVLISLHGVVDKDLEERTVRLRFAGSRVLAVYRIRQGAGHIRAPRHSGMNGLLGHETCLTYRRIPVQV